MSAKKKRKNSLPASHVVEETLGLHSVADESQRKIHIATCRALNQEDKQADTHAWKAISETVLPEISTLWGCLLLLMAHQSLFTCEMTEKA